MRVNLSNMKKIYTSFIGLGLMFLSLNTSAATLYWVNYSGDGLWSTGGDGGCGGNWDDGTCTFSGTPNAGDVVIFDGSSNTNCTIDVATASLAGFQINSGYTSTITQNAVAVNINSGTANFNLSSAATFTGSASNIIIAGTYSQSAGTFNSTTGFLSIAGNFTLSGGTFNPSTGTVSFNSSNLTINNTPTFYNLRFLNTIGGAGLTYTIDQSITVTNNFSLLSGGANATRSITLNKGTGSGIINLQKDITSLGNYTGTSGGGTATIIFNGSGAQAITGPTTDDGRVPLCNLEFNSTTARTITITNAVTTSGNLVLSGAGGDITVSTGTINVNGDLTVTNTGTSGGGSATVVMNGSGAQGITGPTTDDGRAPMCNLEFNSSTARTITITNFLTVQSLAVSGAGDITIDGGTINDLGALTVTNTGTAGGGSATITMKGTSAQTITGSGTAGQGRLPNVTINRASASNNNLSLSSVISVEGNWIYTTAGTGTSVVSPGASTVCFYSCSVDGEGSANTMPFFNVEANGGTVTLAGALDVNGSLTIGASGTLSAAAFSINAAGNFSNSGGTFTHGSNTVTFDGNTTQDVNGAGTSTFYNMTVTGTSNVSIQTTANLENTLTLSGASALFDADGSGSGVFTLRSTSSRTARIAALTTPANFTGNITMQRFIPVANDGWKFFGSPVSGATIGAVDNASSFTGYYSFDETVNQSYNNGYTTATAATSMGVGQGFMGYAPTASNITIDVTGPPNKDNISLPVTFTNGDAEGAGVDGWNLVSNPYPSEIDWELVSLTNVGGTFYVWNADLLSGLGDYAYYTKGSFDYSTYNTLNSSIPSWQAFYVNATAAAPLVSLTESSKSSNSPVFMKTGGEQVSDIIRLTLSGLGLTTQTNVKFMPEATENFDGKYDAYKLFSFSPIAPSICSLNDSIYYATNALPELTSEVSLSIRTFVGTAGIYTISANDLNGILPGSCVMLYDTYLDTTVDLRNNSYTCHMPDTMNVPRFTLNISPPSYSFTSTKSDITCHKADDGMMIVNPGVGTWDYVWKNGIGSVIKSKIASTSIADTLSNLKPAYYSVEVSESEGCGSYIRENFEVRQPGATIAGFNVSSSAIDLAFNAAINFTNTSVMADFYEWNFGDGSSTSTLENPMHTYTAVGEYNVILVANNSDCSLSDTVVYSKINVVNSSTNIGNAASGKSIFIGSNGNNAFVALNFDQPTEVVISIYNLLGQKIMKDIYRHTSNEKIELNISDNSIYLVSVKANDQLVTKKIFNK